MAEFKDREQFIPIRRGELVELLRASKSLSSTDRDLFSQFCRLVVATYHFEYNTRLEGLKDAYAPFDPDRDTKSLLPINAEERQRRLNGLFSDFGWLLERANFKHLSTEDLEPVLHGASDWGLPMDVDFSAFERIALFARGDGMLKRTRRRLRNFYRVEEQTVPIYQRLVLILKMRKHKRLPSDIDTESVYLKVFKSIPKQDVKMLLPGAKVRMSRMDQGKIGVPLLGGLGMVAWKFLNAVGVVLWDLMDDAMGVILSAGGNPWAMWIAASGAAGYGYNTWYGYQQTKQRYHLNLTQSLYYQNLDSNAGVLTRLLDEAEEQDAREAILAYYMLWQHGPAEGWTAAALDDFIELYLEEAAQLKVDFEVGDALRKLEKMRIVEKREDRYHAVPIREALVRLDETWDSFFLYHNEAAKAKV